MDTAEFAKICDALDYNHDQTIHYSDFLAAIMGSQISLTMDMMKIIFRKFDVHNTGFITAAGLSEAGIAEDIFEEVIGKGGSIGFEQFCTICSSDAEPSTPDSDAEPSTQKTTPSFSEFSLRFVLPMLSLRFALPVLLQSASLLQSVSAF
jgi:Ca2+-binding EF-hand superfamily protein